MTDIVERLTAKDILTGVITSMWCKAGRHPGELADLMKEAAGEIARLRAENEKLRERLASVNDENQRIRQSVKEYLSNLARVTNDMLREMWEREAEDERHC